MSEVDPELWADDVDAIAVYDRSAAVGALTMPVTLIAAELDRVATVAAMTELAGRLANAALTVLPGAEHMTPFVEPDALAGLLRRAAAAA
jgi:pimeloyl-ACP methyl ester carboxylesterase